MEQYGIFYFFKHEQGKHTLVMADSPTAHSACPVVSSIPYVTDTGGPQGDVITEWQIEQELRTGKYSHTDYNFQTPSTSLMASVPTVYEVGGNSNFEKYDFFGEHKTKDAGDALAKIRMQEEEAQHLVAGGKSHCRMFVSGYKFTLEDHPRSDMNTDYVLTEIQHTAVTDTYGTQGSPEGESYSNTFTCIPLSVPFRPLRIHRGLPATASTPQLSLAVERSTRMTMAGFRFSFPGTLTEPPQPGPACCRFGPAIPGERCFFPGLARRFMSTSRKAISTTLLLSVRCTTPTRYRRAAPGNKNISGFRTHSTKGGGEHNANVLTFDDTKGTEVFYMRAEKDMAVRVENNEDTTS